jgi:hypothetical protein
MHTTRELLELVSRATGARTTYALAKVLQITETSVARWKKGGTLSDATAVHIARLVNLPPGYVVACMHAERATMDEERALWRDVAEKLRAVAAAVLFALAALLLDHGGALELVSVAHATNGDNTHWATYALLTLTAALVFSIFRRALRVTPGREQQQRRGNSFPCQSPSRLSSSAC